MPPTLRTLLASERLRHAAIATLLAALVAATTILRPLDIAFWSMQSKMFDHAPSGEIVLVSVDPAETAKGVVARNIHLRESLEYLEQAGARRIVIDMSVRRSNSPATDRALRTTLERLGDKVVLTRSSRRTSTGNADDADTSPFFLRDIRVASSEYETDFLGYVWGIDATAVHDGTVLPMMWTALLDRPAPPGELYTDYTIDMPSIPQFSYTDLRQGGAMTQREFFGKTVVLGASEMRTGGIRVPEHGQASPSMIQIVTAETAKRGAGWDLGWGVTVGLFGLLLALIAGAIRTRSRRIAAYALWSLAIVALAVITAKLGARAVFTAPLSLAVIFSLLRFTANFKRRHLYLEQQSRLPNFAALQRDLGDAVGGENDAIVVAKVARLDAIFATLSPTDQGRYVRQIAARLALGDHDQPVYYDGGKNFAFILPGSAYSDLQGHLEGLRAIASQSVTVSDRNLDVSITIGVDQSSGKSIATRLKSAIAAADQAREAYRPVFIISDFEIDSEDWDYSLQARLEDALSEDRIGIKLQPQADLQTGLIVGAEALARWVDEERGDIAPSRFIMQCERVGRLDDLTKRIAQKSLRAAESLLVDGFAPKLSINVSAIQFVDYRIADLIEENLALSPIRPENLTIEVTETARIEDFAAARAIFERIGDLGVKLSIDDFGIASANFDALYELPFSEIKIDQLFVQKLHRSDMARAIVSNLVKLAGDAGLVSVAEGIENHETYSLLRELGCDMGQGYFIARPLTISEFRETLVLQKDRERSRRHIG